MTSIATKLIGYYESISKPEVHTQNVEILYPFGDSLVIEAIRSFYNKYYTDEKKRIMLIGINPGRNGGGVTGIPFTDPIKLTENCGIENEFQKKPELSSDFIYQMIDHLGGPEIFYRSVLLTSVCPLGFTRDKKNLNYYDDKQLQNELEAYMLDNIKWHLKEVGRPIVFSLGQGKNVKYLKYLDEKYGLFESIETLPHPRWVMQYRRKHVSEFLNEYKHKLAPYLN